MKNNQLQNNVASYSVNKSGEELQAEFNIEEVAKRASEEFKDSFYSEGMDELFSEDDVGNIISNSDRYLKTILKGGLEYLIPNGKRNIPRHVLKHEVVVPQLFNLTWMGYGAGQSDEFNTYISVSIVDNNTIKTMDVDELLRFNAKVQKLSKNKKFELGYSLLQNKESIDVEKLLVTVSSDKHIVAPKPLKIPTVTFAAYNQPVLKIKGSKTKIENHNTMRFIYDHKTCISVLSKLGLRD